jgi:DNA repair protein RecO
VRRAPGVPDHALVLRVSPYGDADAVVQMLTARTGAVAALARRARAATGKRTLILEPFHTLAVELTDTAGDLSILRSSTIAIARTPLLEDATRLDAAGVATRWARALLPQRVAEPEVFAALERLLDELSVGKLEALSAFGLILLDTLGYGLELAGCARCARARPAGRAAYVSGVGGGVLCESCRRGVTIDAPLLSGAALDALTADQWAELPLDDRPLIARVVREAMEQRASAVGTRLSS